MNALFATITDFSPMSLLRVSGSLPQTGFFGKNKMNVEKIKDMMIGACIAAFLIMVVSGGLA
jgi:hypothetical protein